MLPIVVRVKLKTCCVYEATPGGNVKMCDVLSIPKPVLCVAILGAEVIKWKQWRFLNILLTSIWDRSGEIMKIWSGRTRPILKDCLPTDQAIIEGGQEEKTKKRMMQELLTRSNKERSCPWWGDWKFSGERGSADELGHECRLVVGGFPHLLDTCIDFWSTKFFIGLIPLIGPWTLYHTLLNTIAVVISNVCSDCKMTFFRK